MTIDDIKLQQRSSRAEAEPKIEGDRRLEG
jgi:hypothetical protein